MPSAVRDAKRSSARARDTCTTYTHNMSVHNTAVRTTLCTNCTKCALSARHHVVCTVVPSFLESPTRAFSCVPHGGSSLCGAAIPAASCMCPCLVACELVQLPAALCWSSGNVLLPSVGHSVDSRVGVFLDGRLDDAELRFEPVGYVGIDALGTSRSLSVCGCSPFPLLSLCTWWWTPIRS